MTDETRDLLRFLWSVRMSRRSVIAAGGAAAAGCLPPVAFAQGEPTPAAQATPVTPATPVASSGKFVPAFNLPAIGPLPIADLDKFGIETLEYQFPKDYPAYGGYLAGVLPREIALAIQAAKPSISCLTSLLTPVVSDLSKPIQPTHTIDALTVVAAPDADSSWDGLFAAVQNGAPADPSIGERNTLWSYDGEFRYTNYDAGDSAKTSQVKRTAMALLFTRGPYAHVIAITDAKKDVTVKEIVAIAKDVDRRLADALSGKIKSSTRTVVPQLDFTELVPTPAFPAAVQQAMTMPVMLRAVDGQLLRYVAESEQAFALAQGTDVKAASDASVTNYRAALDQKATIVISALNGAIDRGRDAFIRAYLPEKSKLVANRSARSSLTVEEYSFPAGNDAKAIIDAIKQRLKDDIDNVYQELPAESSARPVTARQLSTEPQTLQEAVDALLSLIIGITLWVNVTSDVSSDDEEASFEVLQELLEDVALALGFDDSSEPSQLVHEIHPGASGRGLTLASETSPVHRIQYASLKLMSGGYDRIPMLSLDQFSGSDGAAPRAAATDIAKRAFTGLTYSIPMPAPKAPIPPAPVMGDLSTVPFVGLAGAAPYPTGKLAKYSYGGQEQPSLVIPIGIERWGDLAGLLSPSPVADVVYNLPLSLAFVSSVSAPAPDQYSPPPRKIRTQIYIDPATAKDSWAAIVTAVKEPKKSPVKLGEKSAGWLQSGEHDETTYFKPFDGAAVFFQRGPFGVIVDIRDYSGKKPTLKEVATRALPIDAILKAAIAGKPTAAGLLGLPTFGSGDVSYLMNYQQIRAHGGVLTASFYDATDADAFKAAKAAYKLALSKKAALVTSIDPVSSDQAAALFGASAPAGLSFGYLGELYVLADAAAAADFAKAFIDRLKAKYPSSTVVAALSTGGGAEEAMFATVKANDTSSNDHIVIQRVSGVRVGVADFTPWAYDLTKVTLTELAANTAFLANASSIAGQIVSPTGYFFTVAPPA